MSSSKPTKATPPSSFPKRFWSSAPRTSIVQEYVAGLSVAQLLRVMEQGVDPAAYVREYLGSDLDAQLTTLGIESLSGVFDLPRVQGDPHPGNVRLLTGDRVGLIDFGISSALAAQQGRVLRFARGMEPTVRQRS